MSLAMPLVWILILLVIILAIIAFLILFLPSIYVVSNMSVQDYLNISFWKEEISNGFLAIRFISIILAVYFIMFLHEAMYLDKKYKGLRKRLRGIDKKVQSKNHQLKNEEILFLSATNNMFVIVYYNLIVFYIIFAKAIGKESIFIAITSWGLLFIVDDWKIYTDYTSNFKKKMMKWHRIKLYIIDFMLIISVTLASFNMFSFYKALIIVLFPISLYILKVVNEKENYEFTQSFSNQ